MTWVTFFLSQDPGTSVTPVGAAADNITAYILGFGPLGIIVLALAWLLFRGWRLVPPGYEEKIRASGRDEARGDLLKELDRAIAGKDRSEAQRDDALRVASDQVVPLLVEFKSTIAALIPLLQDLVSRREGHDRGTSRR